MKKNTKKVICANIALILCLCLTVTSFTAADAQDSTPVDTTTSEAAINEEDIPQEQNNTEDGNYTATESGVIDENPVEYKMLPEEPEKILETAAGTENATDLISAQCNYNQYSDLRQVADWTIDYNAGLNKIPQDQAVISSKMIITENNAAKILIDDGFLYIAGDLDTAGYNSNVDNAYLPGDTGHIKVQMKEGNKYIDVDSNDYTISLNKDKVSFTLKFQKNISEAYRITYSTYFNKDLCSEYVPGTSYKLTNHIESQDEQKNAEMVIPGRDIISKSVQSENYNKSVINWQIRVNPQAVSLKRLSIADYLPDFQTMVPGSLHVYTNNGTEIRKGNGYNLYIKGEPGFEYRDKYGMREDALKEEPTFQIDILHNSDSPAQNSKWGSPRTITFSTTFDVKDSNFPADRFISNSATSVYTMWYDTGMPIKEGVVTTSARTKIPDKYVDGGSDSPATGGGIDDPSTGGGITDDNNTESGISDTKDPILTPHATTDQHSPSVMGEQTNPATNDDSHNNEPAGQQPKTADTSSIITWLIILALATAIIIAVDKRMKKSTKK